MDLPSLRSSLPPMLRILLVKADKQSKLEPCLPVTEAGEGARGVEVLKLSRHLEEVRWTCQD